MWSSILLLSYLCGLSLSQPAVTPAPDTIPCPVLEIRYLTYVVADQKHFIISVEVNGSEEIIHRERKLKIYEKKSLIYSWKLSAGEIVKGQGTSQITVEAKEVSASDMTATVEVKGFAPECVNKASCSVRIADDSEKSDKP
jgi:hypothetical protein